MEFVCIYLRLLLTHKLCLAVLGVFSQNLLFKLKVSELITVLPPTSPRTLYSLSVIFFPKSACLLIVAKGVCFQRGCSPNRDVGWTEIGQWVGSCYVVSFHYASSSISSELCLAKLCPLLQWSPDFAGSVFTASFYSLSCLFLFFFFQFHIHLWPTASAVHAMLQPPDLEH